MDNEKKIMLDGSLEEQEKFLKKLFGLRENQTYQEIEEKNLKEKVEFKYKK